jgi:hypothetical protein
MSRIAFAKQVNGKQTLKRLQDEWNRVYRPLKIALYALAEHAHVKFGIKNLIVTCIFRTEDENRALPNANPDSLHTLEESTRAVDIRVWGIDKPTRLALIDHWYKANPVGFDLVDEGNHLHAEVDHRFFDEESFA